MKILALLFLSRLAQAVCIPAPGELARFELNGDLTDCLGQAATGTSNGAFSYVTTGAIDGTAAAPTVAASGANINFAFTLLTSVAGTVSFYAYMASDTTTTQCAFWGGSSSQANNIAVEWVIANGLNRNDLNGAAFCNGVTPTVAVATRYFFLITWSEALNSTVWYMGTATATGSVSSLTLVCSGVNARFDTVNANRFLNGFNDADKWANTTGIDRIRYFNKYMTAAEALASVPVPGDSVLSPYLKNSNRLLLVPPRSF